MNTQQAPAAHVTHVTPAAGDASDANRGVTFLVTRKGSLVTRDGLTQSLTSPVPARQDAAKGLLVTRVTRTAGIPYPLHSKRAERTPREGVPQRAPAARVTRVTTLAEPQSTNDPSTVWRPFARDGGAA